MIVDLKKFQYLYESEGEMILMDPETFEQVEAPHSRSPPLHISICCRQCPPFVHSVAGAAQRRTTPLLRCAARTQSDALLERLYGRAVERGMDGCRWS